MFWLIAIMAGVLTIAILLIVRETYPPVLLQRKVKRLQKQAGSASVIYRSKLARNKTASEEFKLAIFRPLRMLVLSPIVGLLALQASIVYGYLYLFFTTLEIVFQGDYGFSPGIVGLTYLGIGIGMLVGLAIFGVMSDRILKSKTAEAKAAALDRRNMNGGEGPNKSDGANGDEAEMKPEYRLPPMIPGAICIPIGLFIYGWTAEYHVFWFVPIFGTVFLGLGLLGTLVSRQFILCGMRRLD